LFAKNRGSLFCGRRIRGSFGQMGELLHSLTQEELGPSPALSADRLRHSKFVGLREDKDARSVVKEQP